MNEIILDNQILPIVELATLSDNIPLSNEIMYKCTHHKLIYSHTSTLTIRESNTVYQLEPGSLIFLKEGLKHSFHRSYKNVDNLYYFHFNMVQPDTEPLTTRHYTLPKLLSNITGSVLEDKIKDYVAYFNLDHHTTNIDIHIRFYDILSECIKFSGEYRQAQGRLSDEIKIYLNDHMNQPLNTKDMEKRFFLTYKYMGTAFKKETGDTILFYHTSLRMTYARRLLTTTQYSIDEISRILGYSDALYFSRVFKKHYGQSPQNYRKQQIVK